MNVLTLFAVLLVVTQASMNAPRQGSGEKDHPSHDAREGNITSPPVSQASIEFRPVFQAPKWEPKNDPTQEKANYWEEAFGPAYTANWVLVASGTPLPPNKPLRVYLYIPVGTVRLGTFRTGTLGLAVDATVEFANALEESVTQHISGLLSCSSTESKFESTVKFRTVVNEAGNNKG